MEILESGHLRKLDHISDSVPVLELFSNIWGAGTKTAQMWYHQVMPAHLPLQYCCYRAPAHTPSCSPAGTWVSLSSHPGSSWE